MRWWWIPMRPTAVGTCHESSFLISPNGAVVSSQGRKPLEFELSSDSEALEGRKWPHAAILRLPVLPPDLQYKKPRTDPDGRFAPEALRICRRNPSCREIIPL